MKIFDTDSIRNVALIGHSGEGKTSLAEAMMFEAKTIDRLGKVDDGSSTMDYDDEEIKRKISISLSLGYAIYRNTKINILDAPGFFDFEGEMVAALHAADSAVVVTSATGSITVGTEKALELCQEKKVSALIFVNAVDKDNSDFMGTARAIMAKYKSVIPIELPIMEGGKMVGCVDVLTDKAYDLQGKEIATPQNMQADVEEFNGKLMELIAETDEELMMKFFDGEKFTEEEIQKGLHAAIADDIFVPLVAGNAQTSKGVKRLMDKLVDLMPHPQRAHKIKALVDGKETEVGVDPSAPFCAQVIKSVVDPYVGKLLIFKVLGGKLSSGDNVFNASVEKPEKIGTLYVLKGKKQEPVDCLNAGDIGAVAKLVYTNTNDTLVSSADSKIEFEKIEFPKPVISYAVKALKDEEKAIQGLIKMQEEDATFKVEKNVETGDVLISGLGEAQLDIMCKRVKSKLGIDITWQEPRVAYRETIRKTSQAEGKHKKQSGGAGQYGDVFIKYEPGAEDGQFEFVDAVVGGAVPRQFIPAVEKGLREAIKHGVLAGYPLVNLKATLYDGKYHPVDSKEIAFVTAAKLSYADGIAAAGPCFLEPIVEAKVTVPDEYLGDILGDMNKRRGRILGTDMANGKQIITAEVPQAEMFRYATDLRSMTQGRGRFEMHVVRYEEVPAMNNDKIIADAKKREEEANKK